MRNSNNQTSVFEVSTACNKLYFEITEAEAAKTSPGGKAGREPRPVKLRISMLRRQDKRKERPGGLKN